MTHVLLAARSRAASPWRRRVTLALIAAVAICSTIVVSPLGTTQRAHAATGDPFNPADANVFVAQNVPTQLFKAIPDANGNVVFQPEGAARAFNYNAIAYRQADNYIYAVNPGCSVAV